MVIILEVNLLDNLDNSDNIDKEILDLFNRYLVWLQVNNLKDTIYNYAFYLNKVYTL